PDDFRSRLVPYLQAAGVLDAEPTTAQDAVLRAAAPLVQERMTLLGEAPGMLGFLFVADSDLVVEDDAFSKLKDNAGDVLDRSISVLENETDWTAGTLQSALKDVLVEELGIKPRVAFAPLRTAVTGRRVSPPLFESMEILGKDSTLVRIRALRARIS